MAQTKHKRLKQQAIRTQAKTVSHKRKLIVSAIIVAMIVLGFTFWPRNPVSPKPVAKPQASPLTLEAIVRLMPHQLEDLDIAEVNLICAKNLKGSENLDIPRMLTRLDEMAIRVRVETDRNMHLFQEKPGDFQNSEAYFRMLALGTVLYECLAGEPPFAGAH